MRKHEETLRVVFAQYCRQSLALEGGNPDADGDVEGDGVGSAATSSRALTLTPNP